MTKNSRQKKMDIFGKADRNGDIKFGKSSIISAFCENVMTQKIQRQLYSVSVWVQELSKDNESNTVNHLCIPP